MTTLLDFTSVPYIFNSFKLRDINQYIKKALIEDELFEKSETDLLCVGSSIPEALKKSAISAQKAEKSARDSRRWNITLGLGLLISLAGAVIAVINLITNVNSRIDNISSQYTKLIDNYKESLKENKNLQEANNSLQKKADNLSSELDELQEGHTNLNMDKKFLGQP